MSVRSLLAAIGVLALLLASAGSAGAAEPLSLPDRITDQVGALGADEPAVRAAIDELAAEDGIELYTVLVPSFTGQGETDWAEATARLSGLQGSDILLAVSVEDDGYAYGWWVDESFPLSEAEVKDMITSDVVPELESQNWDAAVITLAEQLRTMSVRAEEEAASADEVVVRPSWSATTTRLVVGGVVVVLVGAHLFSRRRTPTGPSR